MVALRRIGALVALLIAAWTATLGPSLEQTDEWARALALEASDPLAAAAAATGALESDPALPALAHQNLAFRLGTELAENGHLAEAALLQIALHGRVRAEWSAINAALTLARAGRLAEAEELLGEQEARSRDRAELANHRGLVALGRGDTAAARRHFGRALVAGSRNAGLSLARMDLQGDRALRARIGFRPGVDDAPPHAWALRGWALTLLP